MSRLPSGLRKLGGRWMDPNYRKPMKRAAPKPMTTEEVEAYRNRTDIEMAAFIERQSADFDAYVERVRQSQALARIVDSEARVSVEGDTDLNHDNVEAAE